jgi:hypothetical protein
MSCQSIKCPLTPLVVNPSDSAWDASQLPASLDLGNPENVPSNYMNSK